MLVSVLRSLVYKIVAFFSEASKCKIIKVCCSVCLSGFSESANAVSGGRDLFKISLLTQFRLQLSSYIQTLERTVTESPINLKREFTDISHRMITMRPISICLHRMCEDPLYCTYIMLQYG